ncbi:MAG: hypothetical protein H6744_17405 [Deltaproteobacteria bacterium]|nr:hypothetical protein [Deltaproteobacteria bacterium]MCB9788462.1 hypothetical protein [Deltaproteobacteria bacterium]
MSSGERIRDAAPPVTSDEGFVDWGPALPGGYVGGRVRVMTASPRLVRAAWELARDPEEGWTVRAEGARGEELARAELPPHAREAWVRVPPATRGRLALHAGADRVAILPFETPADAPSEDRSERWASVGPDGRLQVASTPAGRAVERLAGPGGPSSGGSRAEVPA